MGFNFVQAVFAISYHCGAGPLLTIVRLQKLILIRKDFGAKCFVISISVKEIVSQMRNAGASREWLFGAVLVLVASPLWAQGTSAEREACTPDVLRLCSSFMPDADAITACLKQRKADLSGACRGAIYPVARPAQTGAPASAARRPGEGL